VKNSNVRSLALSCVARDGGGARRRRCIDGVGVRGESAYARPRYAICANVLIAALSGEHKPARAGREVSRLAESPLRYSATYAAVHVCGAAGAHTRACRTRADAHRNARVSPAATSRAAPRRDCGATRRCTAIDTRGVTLLNRKRVFPPRLRSCVWIALVERIVFSDPRFHVACKKWDLRNDHFKCRNRY